MKTILCASYQHWTCWHSQIVWGEGILFTLNNMSQIENFQLLRPKLTDGGMWLVVMCTSPNYCPNLTSTDIGAKNQIWNFDRGVPLFASIPYQGFLRLKVPINCNRPKTHSPVWCRNLEVSKPSGSFPVLHQTCQNLNFLEKFWLWWIITLRNYKMRSSSHMIEKA